MGGKEKQLPYLGNNLVSSPSTNRHHNSKIGFANADFEQTTRIETIDCCRNQKKRGVSSKKQQARYEELQRSSLVKILSFHVIRFARSVFELAKQRIQVYVFVLMALGTFLVSSEFIFNESFVLQRFIGRIAGVMVSVYLISLATYAYNDLTDHAVDKVNKKEKLHAKNEYKNTKQSTQPSFQSKLLATMSLFVVGTALSFASLGFAEGIAATVFSILGIVYSHPKTHLKDMFVIKTLVTAVGGAIISLIGLLGATAPEDNGLIYGFELVSNSYLGVVSTVMVFLFWFVLGPLGDVGDIKGDKAGGRKTIPIVIGIKPTFCLVIGAVLMIYLLILYAGVALEDTNTGNMHIAGVLSSTLVSGYVIYRLVVISREHENKKKLKSARTSMRWGIFGLQFSLFLGVVFTSIL